MHNDMWRRVAEAGTKLHSEGLAELHSDGGKGIEKCFQWDPQDKAHIWSAPRPTTTTAWPIPSLLPEDSLPAGQPDPWLANVADASLPTGSAVEADNKDSTKSLIHKAIETLMRAAQHEEAVQPVDAPATLAARAHASALESELATVRAQESTREAKASARESALESSIDALQSRLDAEQEAHAAVVAELRDLRAIPWGAQVPAETEPQNARGLGILEENAQMRSEMDVLRKRLEEQEKIIREHETESRTRDERRAEGSNGLMTQVSSAQCQYLPAEFLDTYCYDEEERQLWTVTESFPVDMSVAQLKAHFVSMFGKSGSGFLDILSKQNGQLVSLPDTDHFCVTLSGKREFYLKGLDEVDLESWRHKMHAERVYKMEAERVRSRSPEEKQVVQKRRRKSTSVLDFDGQDPSRSTRHRQSTSVLADENDQRLQLDAAVSDDELDKQQAEMIVAEEANDVQPASASAANAVLRCTLPTQPDPTGCRPDFEAVTPVVPPPSGRQAETSRHSAPPPEIPGLNVFSMRQKRQRPPPEPCQPETRAPPKGAEPELQSTRALERTFSRSPSWHASSSTGKSARQRQPLPDASVHQAAKPAAAMGPPAVRASGLRAAGAEEPEALCRGVVRGKEARLALKAFDCEQCQAFYEATGATGNCTHSGAAGRAWRPGTSSSRHRFAIAPTSTPPGFWDLSFPHEIP